MVQEASQQPQVQDQQRLSPHCIWNNFPPDLKGPLNYGMSPEARDIRVGPTGWEDKESFE